MSKFCTSCGNEVLPEQTNCTECGSKIDGAEATKISTGDVKSKYVGFGVIAVAAIILIVIIVNIFSPNYDKPIKNLIKGMNKADAEIVLKAFPEDKGLQKMYAGDIEDDDLEDMLDMIKDEYGKNAKYSYKIVDKDKLKRSEIRDKEETLNDYSRKEVKVTDGYELTVDLIIKGKDGKDSEEMDIEVYKIDGKWCILDGLGFSYDYDYSDLLDGYDDLYDLFG